ncbi:hypothetical protein EPI10_009285 [Gossypium australe]|uniref:Uncharacterized protein n=1 Tax=Gossypium australe TaxID=47621 RepID=A0A5B6UHJ1_9ROSI|nr:hypothetical protein EPI10_009285 [Gossypium australe]
MRAHREQGHGTQVDSSISQVQTLEPMAKNVDHAPTIEESQHEFVNEAVSQAMLRVGVARTTPTIAEYWLKIIERILNDMECTSE